MHFTMERALGATESKRIASPISRHPSLRAATLRSTAVERHRNDGTTFAHESAHARSLWQEPYSPRASLAEAVRPLASAPIVAKSSPPGCEAGRHAQSKRVNLSRVTGPRLLPQAPTVPVVKSPTVASALAKPSMRVAPAPICPCGINELWYDDRLTNMLDNKGPVPLGLYRVGYQIGHDGR